MADNGDNSGNKDCCKISSSSEESSRLNGVKATENDYQHSTNIENNTEHVITKEGKLLPKIRAKLEEVIVSKGITKYTVDVSAGSGVGDNFLGFIGKVVIKGVDKNGKPSTWNWIVKTAPSQQIYRNTMKLEFLYEREVYMYEKIFPLFRAFQREKSVSCPFDNYPPFIFSYLEPFNESFAMEDMKSKGYVMRNRKEALDYNHVKFVLKAYAKLHAVSYALRDQKPDLFADLKANAKDSFTAAYTKEAALNTVIIYMRNALETLDINKDAETYTKFKQLSDKFLDIFYDVLSSPSEYSVIGHGDSWVNNMLWLYDDPLNTTVPKDVCLLDFQLSRYGSPACDLSYFIFTCTEKPLRDKYYDDMIKLYYYHLCQQLIEMGSEPEKCLPFSVLEEELKKFSIVGLMFSMMVLSIITKDTDEIPNLRDGDKNQEEVEKEWQTKSKHHEDYCRRVRGCLVDFDQKGYFDCYLN